MSGTAVWYFSRGTGLVALVGLTATTVLGIVSSLRVASPRWPRFVTVGLHRNLSLMTVTVLALHVAAVVVDGYAAVGWVDAVVPFRAGYHPVWVGLGAVATDILLALVVTSLARHRFGYRTWRAVHWAAYAVWPIALAHGLGVGSDSSAGWARVVAGCCAAAVAAALGVRLTARRRAPGHPARPTPSLTTAAGRI